VTLDLIRFFSTPSTIQKALVEFSAYSRESVADFDPEVARGSTPARARLRRVEAR
jgi:hypothetical protein